MMPDILEISKGSCGMLRMLLSWGRGVVPCLCRAGGDVAESAWRQGTARPLWDCEPVGMVEGPVGFAQRQRARCCRTQLASVWVSEQLPTTHARLQGASCVGLQLWHRRSRHGGPGARWGVGGPQPGRHGGGDHRGAGGRPRSTHDELGAVRARRAPEQLTQSDQVVLAATANAGTLYAHLPPLVHAVKIAPPLLVKLIRAARVQTDTRDTLHLARLLAAGRLPAVGVPPPPVRARRMLVAHAGAGT